MKRLILAIIGVIVVAAGLYLLLVNLPSLQKPTQSQNNTISTPSSTSTILIPGWQSCDFSLAGFELQYPADWNIYVYGNAEGMGNLVTRADCKTIDTPSFFESITGEITIATSSNWSSSGGMDIGSANILPQFLENSTTTLGGQPSYVRADGSIFAQGYEISFSTNTPTSTKKLILQSFRFLPQ